MAATDQPVVAAPAEDYRRRAAAANEQIVAAPEPGSSEISPVTVP